MYAYAGDPAVVRLLLDRGADPQHENKNGVSALKMARNRGAAELIDLLEAHRENAMS